MKLPRRKWTVTLHMRSGARQRIVCADFEIGKRNNDLTGFTATRGAIPSYTRLDAVDLITVRRCWLHWEWRL